MLPFTPLLYKYIELSAILLSIRAIILTEDARNPAEERHQVIWSLNMHNKELHCLYYSPKRYSLGGGGVQSRTM
jgi:hypothetical protein